MITKKIIEVPIYHYKVIIAIVDNFEEAKSIYPNIDNNTNGLVLENGSSSTIIVSPNSIPIIVHECEHLKNCIWNYIGQKTDVCNDETDAYLIEYLYEQVSKVVEKHNSKKLLDK